MNIDVLEFIRTCIGEGRIYWTYHVNMRLKGRFISREAVLLSSDTYEIIEKYPEDKYLPSYLVYAEYEKNAIHIQIAIDEVNNNIRIITAYKPSPDKWEEDLKRRKKI
ncbi:MAG: DUF4258 domain-containing protein [Candidatus Eremiobacterota bacterium]